MFGSVFPVKAQGEGFLWPYVGVSGRDWYPTQGCHSDGWGGAVGGIPSTCAVDFTRYSGGEKVNCGEPAMAPVSGDFTNFGADAGGSTTAVIKGQAYWVFFVHGDFVPSGYLKQGDIFGYENTHGNSSACHWHMSVFDVNQSSWVNPNTLQTVGVPAGAGQVVNLDVAKVQFQMQTWTVVGPDYLDGLIPPTVTSVTAPDPNKVQIDVENPIDGSESSWTFDQSKLPYQVDTGKVEQLVEEKKDNFLTWIVVAIVAYMLFKKSPSRHREDDDEEEE
ncbi:MAG: hypothetical protein HYV39_02980 [Candidatus Levybacteria bacterium]|nr:hypothetical protein [Candidatus Levybacteria bacterium]